MYTKKIIAVLFLIVILCFCLCACREKQVSDSITVGTDQSVTSNETDNIEKDNSEADSTVAEENTDQSVEEETDILKQESIDIKTIGGAVIVGMIGMDEQGWYLQPEQPLNVTYEYFLDRPSVFQEQTRISMFDPKDDGIEKAFCLGQTVTVSGTFRFFRDDFQTLYFFPYTITIGKNIDQSYSAPELIEQVEPENLYDPSVPLPKYMDSIIQDGKYIYNAFMLSEETLELMGNDFAVFFVEFVDAFLNYKNEIECPSKHYAEMLSTIIYYEFPMYNACAEPFEFTKHYDFEKGTVSIDYKYDKETFQRIVNQFLDAANVLLANTSPDQTDEENAKSIYHALCTRMTYDYSALEDFERKECYYAYLYNSGVCITFANVYNQLLNQVGIKSTLAHCDNIDTIGHSWSVITLEGMQYFCDPTYEISYDNGNGYLFFGMNYADRTADGVGTQGIRYGRYYVKSMSEDMISEKSLNK